MQDIVNPLHGQVNPNTLGFDKSKHKKINKINNNNNNNNILEQIHLSWIVNLEYTCLNFYMENCLA